MKRTNKRLTLRAETIRAIDLHTISGGATNTGTSGNTLQICIDTDLATNCLCGGYTDRCGSTVGCQATTQVIC